jgi:flagellar motor switch protein FliN/FliY
MEFTAKEYDTLVDTEIVVDVMLGHTDITIKDFLNYSEGEVLALNKTAGDGGDIYVNQRIIGTGDIIVMDEKLAIRVQDAMDAENVVNFFFDEQAV